MLLTMTVASRPWPQPTFVAQNEAGEKSPSRELCAGPRHAEGQVTIVAFVPTTTTAGADTPFAEIERVVVSAFRGLLGHGTASRQVTTVRARAYLGIAEAVATRLVARRAFRSVAVMLREVARDYGLDAVVVRVGHRTVVFACAARRRGEQG